MKIVTVVKDAAYRDKLEKLLRKLRQEYKSAGTASGRQEGYRLIKEEVPDLIIADISLPRTDGLLMLKKVRKEKIYSKVILIAEKEDFSNDIIDNTFAIKQSGILVDIDNEKGYLELKQGEDYKYYNFKFEEKTEAEIFGTNTLFLSKKDGKYGFVDKNGNVVVDYIYDDATKQNSYGFAGVKKDGKWGSVDRNGNVVQEPTYNLDEYLKIDFCYIG